MDCRISLIKAEISDVILLSSRIFCSMQSPSDEFNCAGADVGFKSANNPTTTGSEQP